MKNFLNLKFGLVTLMILALASCTKREAVETVQLEEPEPRFVDISRYMNNFNGRSGSGDYTILKAEYITAGESGEIGATVIFSDVGNKQLSADFVPALSAFTDGTPDISYYVDENRPSGDVSVGVSTAAIDRAMATWDDATCSDLGMYKVPYDGRPTGFVSLIFGYGGSTAYVADVVHNGWLPAAFFDLLAPNGSASILGVTFTITFTGTDVDNNGKADVAWREIYYNDNFFWQDGASVDVESIALHEAGHGLSQAHFGKAFVTPSNGQLHFAPSAVMNAGYFGGVQTDLEGTDMGGHCSNWGQWPNN